MTSAGRASSQSQQLDAFDRLLEPAPVASDSPAAPRSTGSTGAVERSTPEPSTALGVDGGPTLAQFADGIALYADPILCAVLAGAGLGGLGVFAVLRRAVFVTATISTAAGLGVVLAFFLQIHHALELPPVACALVASLTCTWLVGARPAFRLSRETLVALVYVVTSALIVLLGTRIAQEAHDISAVLFGSAVLVRPIDVWSVLGATTLSFGLLAMLHRPLTFLGFDPDGARVQGVPVERIDAAFWGVLALQVSVATRALGSLPVFAFCVLPSAAGLFVAKRVPGALVIAVGLGALSGGLGYLAAFLGELPVGASQAAVSALLALAAYGIARLCRN